MTKALTVGIHQPNFMPWAGYFNKIHKSDVFVIIDDVQFVKQSICNRVKIKNTEGEATWLTVPVRFENGSASTFNQTKIADPGWYQKPLNLLRNSYQKAPYFETYFGDIEAMFKRPYESLAQFNILLIKYFCEQFEISTPIHIQSEIKIPFGKKNFLNLGITQHFEGAIYLSGNGARKYNDHDLFRAHGIEIVYNDFKPSWYQQLHGEFVEGLSVIDLLFNEGSAGASYIKGSIPQS